jgi:hypothetical protein
MAAPMGPARVSLGAAPVHVRSASPRAIGVVLKLEGEGEDPSVIGEAQWFFSRWASFSIACAQRLASDALIEGQVLAAQPDAE